MKNIFYACILFLALATNIGAKEAQSVGTVTVENVTMEMKSVVALFYIEKYSNGNIYHLAFWLLPFQPTPSEVAALQKQDRFLLKRKQSPYIIVDLGWLDGDAIGNTDEAKFNLAINGTSPTSSLQYSLSPAKALNISLAGTIKEGEEVTLSSQWSKPSSESLPKEQLSWNLHFKAKILSAQPLGSQ